MKSAKSLDMSTKSKNQSSILPIPHVKGTGSPLVDSSIVRQNPQFLGSSPDTTEDNDNPDVIPNQYGK
jgi:hypothetical protein